MKNHLLQIDQAKCIGCGKCQQDCPENNILLNNNRAVVRTQTCIKCGHCVAICPQAAVTMTGLAQASLSVEQTAVIEPEHLLAALRRRRSIRRFKERDIDPDTLLKIIEAGRWTPSAKNAQDVAYIVLKEELADCEKIAVGLFRNLQGVLKWFSPVARRVAIDDHFFFKKAPVVLVVTAKNKINGALAASNMALMAEAQGLGVLYSGFFAQAAVLSPALRKKLELKRGEKVVTALVIGYPDVHYYRIAPKEAAKVQMR